MDAAMPYLIIAASGVAAMLCIGLFLPLFFILTRKWFDFLWEKLM